MFKWLFHIFIFNQNKEKPLKRQRKIGPLLAERHSEFLNLKKDCTGSSESTLVKLSHCWKSHGMAHFIVFRRRSAGLI